ncbi:MAG: type II secretion system GspH family protein [Elusimicrobiales bacterium]|nr:type II secretion system GspH family protein [Elusimicrobiales bacterium]
MKKGYTLVEIIVALAIFAFMSLALSGVFATANRFFYHQYREDVLKVRFITAMKYIQNKMMVANEILTPTPGNVSTSITFFTNAVTNPSNTNQICNPYSPVQPQWHHFCLTPCSPPLSGNCLYYHWGNLAITNCPTYTNIPPISVTCGSAGNVVFMSDSINSITFSRQNLPINLVRVNLSLFSQAKGNQTTDAGIVGRDISHTFETYISINKVSQF